MRHLAFLLSIYAQATTPATLPGPAAQASSAAAPASAAPAPASGAAARSSAANARAVPAGAATAASTLAADPSGAARPPSAPVLGLRDAEQLALARQPSLAQARAQTRAAEGRRISARSTMLPQITASASYQRVHGAARAGTVSTGTSSGAGVVLNPSGGTYDSFSVGASASQVIWDFGQGFERTRAAARLVEASEASTEASATQLLFEVRRAFFQARAQKALARVAEQTLANQRKHLDQIVAFVTTGTRPSIDLAQARSDVANSRVQLINAENDYAVARAALRQAMGDPRYEQFEVSDEVFEPVAEETLTADAILPRALAARADIVALQRQRDAQQATVRAIRGAYGPTLTAVGGVSEAGQTLDALGLNWNVGATLTWPLLQGGLTSGQLDEASANVEATDAQLRVLELQVRVEVDQALLSARAAKATSEAATEGLTNARERLRLAEGRYASGVGNIIELGDAQLSVANSEAQLVQSELTLATARAQFLSTLGRR